MFPILINFNPLRKRIGSEISLKWIPELKNQWKPEIPALRETSIAAKESFEGWSPHLETIMKPYVCVGPRTPANYEKRC